jgi:Arc/MetJ family transcription regulator
MMSLIDVEERRRKAMSARTTIHLDDQLLARARRFVPARGLSRFINQTLAARIDALEREEIEAAMKAGYLATRPDRKALDEDWQVVEGEGWPE